MVIATSALIAIMLNEPSAQRLVAAIEQSQTRMISAGTVIELSLVLLGRYGEQGDVQLDSLLRSMKAETVACDAAQVEIARDAARTFGGGHHGSALNFGDYFSYALAMARGEPLLFVGNHFANTDVPAVVW